MEPLSREEASIIAERHVKSLPWEDRSSIVVPEIVARVEGAWLFRYMVKNQPGTEAGPGRLAVETGFLVTDRGEAMDITSQRFGQLAKAGSRE